MSTTSHHTALFAAGIAGIKNALRAHKGQNLRATWQRPVKLRKDAGTHTATKTVSLIVRGGIDYDKMKAVIEGRDTGELPAENAGLPWGEWVEFPIHITHKGADYVRIYPASGLDFPAKVSFELDGKPVTKEELAPLCLASEFAEREEAPLCYTVKAENIVSIG